MPLLGVSKWEGRASRTIRESEDLPVTIVLRPTADNLGKSKLGALPSPLLVPGFCFLGTKSVASTFSEGIQMEKFLDILHSYRPSSDATAYSILPEPRSFSVLIGNWFTRQSKFRQNWHEDFCENETLGFFDAEYCSATALEVGIEPHVSCQFQPIDSSYSDPEPATADWERFVFNLPHIWGPPEEQESPSSDRILCLDECELFEDFLSSLTRQDFAIDRFRYFIIGSLVHLAALSMVFAIPTQTLRGLGGISEKPIIVKLQTESEAVTPDDPSPGSVDSPASLASLARRDPIPEKDKVEPESEKERLTEIPQQELPPEPESSPLNEKRKDETILAHERVPQEHSQKDDRPNNSKSLHDSIASAPSVARPEKAGALKAGDEAESYKDRILSAIYDAAYYPRAALKNMANGQAVVCFTINKDGSLAGVSIVGHADSEILDKAALKIVEKASSHFPPIPDALMKDQLTYVVPIIFKKRS